MAARKTAAKKNARRVPVARQTAASKKQKVVPAASTAARATKPPPVRPGGSRARLIKDVIKDASLATIDELKLTGRRLAWAVALTYAVVGAIEAVVFQNVDERWPDAAVSSEYALRRVAAFYGWYVADRALRRDADLYRGLQRDGRAIARRLYPADEVVADVTGRLQRTKRGRRSGARDRDELVVLLDRFDDILTVRRLPNDRTVAKRLKYFTALSDSALATVDEFYRRVLQSSLAADE